ncbi:MAG TPA: alpha/beta fold hydrolase [Acidimicrobiales bacterium]|nr:alpha/beta fold hydrolase [Acidimicrobiales bacterium]
MVDVPEVRFAPARGGARLAYQRFGSGPATIVAIPPLAQNIEMAWERPEVRAMLERFASFSDYVVFDKRGTGSSDRSSTVPGIDERVDDLRAVMDHAGIDRAHLFAQSEGGPTTLLFAATYPERVEGVILHGSAARLMPDDPTDAVLDEIRRRQDDFVRRWGTPESITVARFAPSMANDREFCEWHQRYERRAAASDALREQMRLNLEVDVREVLPRLDMPVLLLHRTGDLPMPIELAREVADAIPGARLVEEPGADHFAYVGGIDGWMAEVERFVTGTVSDHPPARPAPLGRHAVRVVTLGRFAVEVDGVEVPPSEWGSRLARQLCKRLVVARGWPVTRDELTEMLWPDAPEPERLSARLSVQLSAVRRVLRGGVTADRQTVALDLHEVSTDLEALLEAPDDETVVDVFGGDLLPEDRYDDWSAAARRQAASRFRDAARRLASAAVRAGEPVRAIELAHRSLDLDPYDEVAHRLLVGALIGSGELGRAREAHRAWVRAMDELGVPVPEFDPTGRSYDI